MFFLNPFLMLVKKTIAYLLKMVYNSTRAYDLSM